MAYDKRNCSSKDVVKKQHQLIIEKTVADLISEYSEEFVGILNITRQFVFVNKNYSMSNGFIGKRPGALLGCIHADESKYGCGDAGACEYCDAVISITEALQTRKKVTRECRILAGENGEKTLNLRVTSAPLNIDHEYFILLFVKDINREKRMEFLERAFFHDVLNIASSLKSLVSLSSINSEFIPDAEKSIRNGISDMVEQIQYFRKLKMAEDGDLVVKKTVIDVSAEMRSIVQIAGVSDFSVKKNIRLDLPDGSTEIKTDVVLFRRIVLNLVINALEASVSGDEVVVRLEFEPEFCRILISNPAVIPPDVKAQIFQRAFSTKGPGRGIGTYSARMLGERYLGGRVGFSSSEVSGTVFRVEIPLYNK